MLRRCKQLWKKKTRSECTIFVPTDIDPLKFTARLYYSFVYMCSKHYSLICYSYKSVIIFFFFTANSSASEIMDFFFSKSKWLSVYWWLLLERKYLEILFWSAHIHWLSKKEVVVIPIQHLHLNYDAIII